MPDRRTFLRSTIGAGLLGLIGRMVAQAAEAVGAGSRLASTGFRGEIVTPASPGYEQARRMFVHNPRRQARPQTIAVCADDEDVRRALAFALENGLEFSVRAGGHDMLAASTCNGLVIDLSALQSIHVDTAARQAHIGAGVRAGALNAALAGQGLAAALGCAAGIGVAGLTLGGGLGWLVGQHGAACDHLLAARLVTAEGRMLRVGRDQCGELLWALRGGGGNFGIVTELTLGVHPVPAVTSGIVALRGNRIGEFLRRHRDYLASAGDAVDIETFIFVPEDEPVIFIKACYSGEPEHAGRALEPLRRLAPYLADDLAARPYTGSIDPTGSIVPLFKFPSLPQRPDDEPGFHVRATSVAPIVESAADIIAEHAGRGEAGWAIGLAHYVHGVASRVPSDHSCMPRVDGLITTYFLSFWRQADEAQRRMAWADEAAAALEPHAGPMYINYMSSDDPVAIRHAYGSNYARLAAVKRDYDRENIFHRNRNIEPAGCIGNSRSLMSPV